jgi:hypothetical protein
VPGLAGATDSVGIQCFGWNFRLTGFGAWLSRTTQ